MSEFEKSWIESERQRHQRLLQELKQECQSSPQATLFRTAGAKIYSYRPGAAPLQTQAKTGRAQLRRKPSKL